VHVLNKQLQASNRRWLSSLWVGQTTNTPTLLISIVTDLINAWLIEGMMNTF
jgi:hypothetical protein